MGMPLKNRRGVLNFQKGARNKRKYNPKMVKLINLKTISTRSLSIPISAYVVRNTKIENKWFYSEMLFYV